eukprot:m.87555 g.87555  ORF g.87555 m.87555 type:complete len:216 (+) comp15132_c0_seq1:407-1054(+)
MSSNTELTTSATRLKLQIQQRISKLAGRSSIEEEEQVSGEIEQMDALCERLQQGIIKEPINSRQFLKTKVDQLLFDCQELRKGLEAQRILRRKREKETKDREDLLSKTYTTNSDSTLLMIDEAYNLNNQNQRLEGASRGMSDLIGSAEAILSDLRSQGTVLKRAHRRVLDMLNTLGLSNTVMRLIEQRGTQDRWILWGGMIVSLVIMFLIYHYFG